MAEEQNYRIDTDGYEYVTNALMEMINQFPGLLPDERFEFSMMPESAVLSVIASPGSFIIEEHVSITDYVWQVCAYPFMVVCRASGLSTRRKINTKEWMDTLAEWMCRKTVRIDNQAYQLERWPKLEGDRKIDLITRRTPAYLGGVNEDKSENWVMELTIQYTNEFQR